MIKAKTSFLILTTGLLFACGGADSKTESTAPASAPAATAGEGGHGGMHGHEGMHGMNAAAMHHHNFTPEMNSFHTTMMPVWHAKHGAKRMADGCAVAPKLVTQAQAIASAAKPQGAADTWPSLTAALVSRAKAVATTCQGDKSAFESSMKAMHEGFHAVLKAMPNGMHKGMHCGGMHKDMSNSR